MNVEFEQNAIWIDSQETVRVRAKDQNGNLLDCLIPRETFDDHSNGDTSNDYVAIFMANREQILSVAAKLIKAGVVSKNRAFVLETKYF